MIDEFARAVDLSPFVSDGHVCHSLGQKSDRRIQRIFLRGLCHSVRRFACALGNRLNNKAYGQPCLKICLTLATGQRSP